MAIVWQKKISTTYGLSAGCGDYRVRNGKSGCLTVFLYHTGDLAVYALLHTDKIAFAAEGAEVIGDGAGLQP